MVYSIDIYFLLMVHVIKSFNMITMSAMWHGEKETNRKVNLSIFECEPLWFVIEHCEYWVIVNCHLFSTKVVVIFCLDLSQYLEEWHYLLQRSPLRPLLLQTSWIPLISNTVPWHSPFLRFNLGIFHIPCILHYIFQHLYIYLVKRPFLSSIVL